MTTEQRLEHEHASDDHEQQFLLDQNGDGAKRRAERERSDVAHEDFGGIRVVPEEAERRADERAAEDASAPIPARKCSSQQVLGEHSIADDVGERGVRAGGDRDTC